MRELRSFLCAAVALLAGYGALRAAPVGPGDINPPPFGVTSAAPVFSTILLTGSFQVLFPYTPNVMRNGCLYQNTGNNTQYLFQHTNGTDTTASQAGSWIMIPPGNGIAPGAFNCSTGAGGVIQDQIDVAGTPGDTFTARIQ